MNQARPLLMIAVLACAGVLRAAEFSPVGVGDRALAIRKVPVEDCRVVRGFLGTPVDGTVKSRDYRGTAREYPKTASDGVVYAFNRNDGVHITLSEPGGFDLVVLRGGAKARMYVGRPQITERKDRRPLAVFPGGQDVQVIRFDQRIPEKQISFFGVEGGAVADVSFYQIEPAERAQSGETWIAGAPGEIPADLAEGMKDRYGEAGPEVVALSAEGKARSMEVRANRPLHLITAPMQDEKGIASVWIEADLAGGGGPIEFTAIVQDPLSPHRDLMWVPLRVEKPGRVRLLLDIPDQVMLKGSRLWVTLLSNRQIALGGLRVGPGFVSRERALPQAVAHRKLLLKSLFMLMSEPRPWMSYRKQSREEFFASSRYAQQCVDLFVTIDQCHALAPDDPMIRQYREWVYAENLERFAEVPAPPAPPEGVPAWAWYPRSAWLEVRRVAEWWLDHRLVPTGEFGGALGDDSDLYQQFVDLPFFEDDGVAARLKDAAANLAELAEQNNLRGGINRHATDSLHAYEEGINHLALMMRWFYGDPIYAERCMESARNMEKLTIVTPDGRRFFRNRERMGAEDIDKPRPPTFDGETSPLMWHTALQVADYNRNPKAIGLVREWADSWLKLMKPGQWATDVEVMTGKVRSFNADRPLYGGYRTQGVVFTWLTQLTGERKYVEPFLYYYRQGRTPSASETHVSELYSLGLLEGLDQKAFRRLVEGDPILMLRVDGKPDGLVRSAIGNPRSVSAGISTLYDAQRFPDMYTTAEPFTDRLFLDLLRQGSVAYLGGFTRRNKFNPAQAVSWEGLGTEYAALVVTHRPDALKVLVYNFASHEQRGAMRLWSIEHGEYEVKCGDAPATRRELARADKVQVNLSPRAVTTIELKQVRKLEPIELRADLAICGREMKIEGNRISGIIHNIGSADVADVVVSVVDETGRVIARRSIGSLEAPIDLVPRRQSFALDLPSKPARGWRVLVDPESKVPEIYEGNNAVELDRLTKQ